jgi:hypothetical protein
MTQIGMRLDMTRMGWWEAEALERNLRKRVVGHEDAIRCMPSLIRCSLLDYDHQGVLSGSFCSLGPLAAARRGSWKLLRNPCLVALELS